MIIDVVRLLRAPEGKERIHRLFPPLAGMEQTARALRLLLEEQMKDKGQIVGVWQWQGEMAPWRTPQGQRSLKRCPGNYFQQEVFVPTATATLHRDAILPRMLF